MNLARAHAALDFTLTKSDAAVRGQTSILGQDNAQRTREPALTEEHLRLVDTDNLSASAREIAAATGKRPETVRQLLYRHNHRSTGPTSRSNRTP